MQGFVKKLALNPSKKCPVNVILCLCSVYNVHVYMYLTPTEIIVTINFLVVVIIENIILRHMFSS